MCIKANMPLPIHNRSPVSHSQRLATIPTQRSVIARLRYSSLDGGCVEVSLCRATRISVFPRNAAMDRKMLKAERKVIAGHATLQWLSPSRTVLRPLSGFHFRWHLSPPWHLSWLPRYVQAHAVLTLDFHLYRCQVLSAISPSCNLLTTNFYFISFV